MSLYSQSHVNYAMTLIAAYVQCCLNNIELTVEPTLSTISTDSLNVKPHRHWIECMLGAGRRRRLQSHRSLQDTNDKSPPLLPGQILLAHDEPISVVPYIADLLDNAQVHVLIYNGDRDMTTNAMSSEVLLDAMEWSGAKAWADPTQFSRSLWLPATTSPSINEHTLGGYIKSYAGLDFLVVSNSGHLVPFNEPDVALDLVTRFLGNVSFHDKPLPYFVVPESAQGKDETSATSSTSPSKDKSGSDTTSTFSASSSSSSTKSDRGSSSKSSDKGAAAPSSSSVHKNHFSVGHGLLNLMFLGAGIALGMMLVPRFPALWPNSRRYQYQMV
jgi:Serine carboxypeptidase